ncbi:P-loop containing nucleoside triphosphate hydrolase protein [Lentinula edodes]|uniref:P-loop containing nucleoside triphosphate hydrolase protein n=1 Tax=Lentinula edodes TaxID=5353 RepID=UPI001E8CEE60|nr:P-loop containing nucleoside triphosphate hydrolase protein [Lentinula edodes]KAH7871531.1 P-loop containing nucleoside triphosphate hydrolase protein [Lentinula edodes]
MSFLLLSAVLRWTLLLLWEVGSSVGMQAGELGIRSRLQTNRCSDWNESGPLHWAVAPQPRVVDKLLVLVAIMVVHNCNRGMVGAYRPSLIDLAGFEKATSHKERTRGGKYINKSLLTLGTVISKLWDNATKQKNDHIPFHDSKLTRLLQPSLSGNARISVICTISPDPSPVAESTSTLLFAKRVKGVKLHAQKKEVIDTDVLIERYRKEMDDLNLLLGVLLVLVESALYIDGVREVVWVTDWVARVGGGGGGSFIIMLTVRLVVFQQNRLHP